MCVGSPLIADGVAMVLLDRNVRCRGDTQGRSKLLLSFSPLIFEVGFSFLFVNVQDVGEIHRVGDVTTLVLPSLNRKMLGRYTG